MHCERSGAALRICIIDAISLNRGRQEQKIGHISRSAHSALLSLYHGTAICIFAELDWLQLYMVLVGGQKKTFYLRWMLLRIHVLTFV